MTRQVLAIAILIFSTSGMAASQSKLELKPLLQDEPAQPCLHLPGNPASCSKFVGCIGDKGEYFWGHSRGWNIGTLTAQTSAGTTCSGTWKYRNIFGIPQADLFCNTGEGGRMFYFYQDSVTGTAKGKGRSNKGRVVEMWSGNNLKQFFKNAEPDAEFPTLHCGPANIQIS